VHETVGGRQAGASAGATLHGAALAVNPAGG
jgi:hypothetical protein